jgi:hypothetical protein
VNARATLVVDTRAPAPRRVGGGLDDPDELSEIRRRRNRRTTTQPAVSDHLTPPRPPAITPHEAQPEEPETIELQRSSVVGSDELGLVRQALASVVPASSSSSLVDLVRLVAAKLEGHGAHCAAVVNPPRGSLSPEEVRVRCSALLLALAPVERHAVLGLLAGLDDMRATAVGSIR